MAGKYFQGIIQAYALKRFDLFIGLTFCWVGLSAQSLDYQIRPIHVEDGISQSSVECIAEDSLGFLWLGTEDGLNRYDGYEYKILKHQPQNPQSICNNHIRSLMVDYQGMIWIGTQEGLTAFDPRLHQFYHYLYSKEDSLSINGSTVMCMKEDKEKNLWIGTNLGLCRLIREGADPADWYMRQYRAEKSETPKGLTTGIEEDVHGDLWVSFGARRRGETLGGLARYIPARDSFEMILHTPDQDGGLPTPYISTIEADPAGGLWLGTMYMGLLYYQPETGTFTSYLPSKEDVHALPHPYIKRLVLDQKGQLWVGTYQGMALLEDRKTDSFQRLREAPYHLGLEIIIEIYEDQAGNIWIGGSAESIRLIPRTKPFMAFTSEGNGPLPGDDLIGMQEMRSGELWVQMYGTGISRVIQDQGRLFFHHYSAPDLGLKTNEFVDLTEDTEGHIWMASFNGLYEWILPGESNPSNPPKPIVRSYFHAKDQENSPASNYFYDVKADARGFIWVANYTGGLERIRKKGSQRLFDHYSHQKDNPFSLMTNRPTNLDLDDRGVLWVSCVDGLSRLYENEKGEIAFRHIREHGLVNPSTPSPEVKMVWYDTKAATLWMASNGLFKVQLLDEDQSPWEKDVSSNLKTQMTYYGEAEGLANNFVYGLLPDAHGRIWLSHNRGLSCFDPKTEHFENYEEGDGLQSNEFSANAFCAGKGGWMYFGGIKGYNRFHPDSILQQEYLPRPMLTKLSLYNQEVEVGKPHKSSDFSLNQTIEFSRQINLSWRDYVVSFDFVGLGYTQPERYQYAYQLVGLNEDWVQAGKRRHITYTNLEPGDYTFQVKVANEDGIWNPQPFELDIHVSTPPWKSWWAFILYGLILFGLITAIIRYRTRKVRQELEIRNRIDRARMNERETVRARSSRDFHDEAGNKLTKISLYTGLTKRKAESDPEMMEFLNQIEANIGELSSGMRDFIWVLDPRQDGLQDALLRIRDFGNRLFEHTAVQFLYENALPDGLDDRLEINTKRHLLLIFKEAMHNALKYARCTEVRLKVSMEQEVLRISLIDNGLGFDPQSLKRVNGLNNMRSRAKECQAELEIDSNPGIGTRVTFIQDWKLHSQNHPNG